MGALSVVAFCKTLSNALVGRLLADLGLHGGDLGATLPDHAPDGQGPDSLSKWQTH